MLHGANGSLVYCPVEGSTEQYTNKTQADIGSRYIFNTKAIGVIHLKSSGGMQVLDLEHESLEDTSYLP